MTRLRQTTACLHDAEYRARPFPDAPADFDIFDDAEEERCGSIWDGPAVGVIGFVVCFLACVL